MIFLCLLLAYCFFSGFTIGYILINFFSCFDCEDVAMVSMAGICWPISPPAALTINLLERGKKNAK